MATPTLFFVIARVWRDRLAALCAVSKTEPYSHSYYWGYDIDGSPDTIWGLEGYYHPVGFFMNHVSTDIFKEEMEKVDEDKLLRTTQGLTSPDYDLHHYDFFSGFVKRDDAPKADDQDGFVVVVHLWAFEGQRMQLLRILSHYAESAKRSKKTPGMILQSFAVLKELNHFEMVTAYFRTETPEDYEKFKASDLHKSMLDEIRPFVSKKETHRSQAFIGHIGQDAPCSGL